MKIEDFKVGQKVKKVGGDVREGEIAVVISIYHGEGCGVIKLEYEKDKTNWHEYFNPQWWEPVTNIQTLEEVIDRFHYISYFGAYKMTSKRSSIANDLVWISIKNIREPSLIRGMHLSSETLRQMSQDFLAMAIALDNEE